MHTTGTCDCDSCASARKLWADARDAESEEKLLLENNGAVSFSERTKAVILARGREVSPYFDERNSMHRTAESVEEELKRTMGRIFGEGDPDVEIRELRTDRDDLKRFEVTVKRPELEDSKTKGLDNV